MAEIKEPGLSRAFCARIRAKRGACAPADALETPPWEAKSWLSQASDTGGAI